MGGFPSSLVWRKTFMANPNHHHDVREYFEGISLYSLIWDFSAFWDSHKYKNMDKITRILENVVRCKYFEAGVHIKNPIKNSYQDGLGRTTQTLEHVVVVHILIWDKRKSQIYEYSDASNFSCLALFISIVVIVNVLIMIQVSWEGA